MHGLEQGLVLSLLLTCLLTLICSTGLSLSHNMNCLLGLLSHLDSLEQDEPGLLLP